MKKTLLLVWCLLEISVSHATEGFLAGTMLQTVHGQKAIENLDEDDRVLGCTVDESIQPQVITGSACEPIGQYIKLQSADRYICCAPGQKFYLPHEQQWVIAENITPSTVLSESFVVERIETINQEVECFAITVGHHNFYILDDIVAHNNAGALIVPITRIIIGQIAAINPITATIGATLTCAAFVAKLYDAISFDRLAQERISQETKSYYENRRQQLELMYSRFQKIQTDVAYLSSSYSFTPMYFNEAKKYSFPALQLPKISANYVNNQKLGDPTGSQDAHLQQLEHDIITQQVMIAFHFDQLVDRTNKAWERILDFQPKLLEAADHWNERFYTLTHDATIKTYELYLTYEELLLDFQKKTDELQAVIAYYKTSQNAAILKNTTNIMELIAREEESLTEKINHVDAFKQNNLSNQKAIETGLAEKCFYVSALKKQLTEKINALRKKIALTEQSEMKQQRDAIQFFRDNADIDMDVTPPASPGAPNPNDPDNDKHNRNRKRKNDFDFEKLRKSIEYGMIENNRSHYFEKKKHGFDELLDKLGGKKNLDAQKKLIGIVIEELMRVDTLPVAGEFETIPISIDGYTIHVRGVVHEGVIKLGTMFIPY